MAIFRVNNSKDYIVISNYPLLDKKMSLDAKGLLCLMLSLPDEWEFSISDLVSFSSDTRNNLVAVLHELEQLGYLKRVQLTNDEYRYDVLEKTFNEGISND